MFIRLFFLAKKGYRKIHPFLESRSKAAETHNEKSDRTWPYSPGATKQSYRGLALRLM